MAIKAKKEGAKENTDERICFMYRDQGVCKFGRGCKFKHESPAVTMEVTPKFVVQGAVVENPKLAVSNPICRDNARAVPPCTMQVPPCLNWGGARVGWVVRA